MNTDNQKKYERHLKRHKLTAPVEVYDRARGDYLGRLVNIHREGFMVMSDAEIATDKLYQIDIKLPHMLNGHEEIHLGVDCLWSREAADHSLFWAGFHIIDMSDACAKDIEDLVQQMGE